MEALKLETDRLRNRVQTLSRKKDSQICNSLTVKKQHTIIMNGMDETASNE